MIALYNYLHQTPSGSALHEARWAEIAEHRSLRERVELLEAMNIIDDELRVSHQVQQQVASNQSAAMARAHCKNPNDLQRGRLLSFR